MKQIISILSLSLLLGCSSVQVSDRLTSIARTAAVIGTELRLKDHPEDRPAFTLAEQALTRLIDAQDYDPGKFADALKGLPINELRGKDGSLYISLAVVVWDEVAVQAQGVEKQEQVKKVILAVRDGIRFALAK